jgi:hypothetical protein
MSRRRDKTDSQCPAPPRDCSVCTHNMNKMTRDLRLAEAGHAALPRDSNRPRRAAAPRFGALALALILSALALVAACTTARERDNPSGISGVLRFRNAETEEHFRASYRSGNLYLDFRPVMIADAIFQDERYRALYLKTMRDRYMVPGENLERMIQDEQERFDGYFEFLVFLYGGSNTPIRLNAKTANWRLLMRDDDGDLLQPVYVHEIRDDSHEYRYIQGYFSGLDRWSQLYIVRFPKLEKAVAGQPVGKHPFELLVTGMEGTITMRWENPNQFYRGAEGIRLPPLSPDSAPAESAEAPKGEPGQTGRKGAGDESG